MWQFWWKLQAFHCTNSIKHLHQPWCCHGTACKIQHPSKISKVFSETGDSIRLCRQHPAATLDFISPRTGKHPFFPCMLELRLWHDGRQDIHNQQIYTNMYIRFCFTQEHGNQILLDPICLFPVGPFFAFFPSDLHARFLRRSSWPFPRPRGLRSGSCSGCSMESRPLDTGFESTFISYPRTHRDQRASQLFRALMLFGFGTSSFWPIPITSGKETGCYWQRDFSVGTTWFRRCVSITWTFRTCLCFCFQLSKLIFHHNFVECSWFRTFCNI